MKHAFKVLGIAALVSSPALTYAESPSWNAISASYSQTRYDDDDEFKPRGFGLEFSTLVADYLLLGASYEQASDDVWGIDIDITGYTVGAGARLPLNATTDAYITGQYVKADIESSYRQFSYSNSENGYSASTGVRSMLTKQFELGAGLGYTSIADDDNVGMHFGARFYFTPQFSVGLGYSSSDNGSTTSASLSAHY